MEQLLDPVLEAIQHGADLYDIGYYWYPEDEGEDGDDGDKTPQPP